MNVNALSKRTSSHQRQCLLEVVLRLAGKADDEVGAEREVRDRQLASRSTSREVAVAVVRAPHRLEDRATSPTARGRWTCSQTLAHSAIAAMTGSRKSFGCGLVKRIRSMPATSSHARRSSPNSVRELGREVAAPGVDVLAEQGDLAHAVAASRVDLGDDLPRPPALLAAANGRDDAVRAHGVAAHRDLHPGLEAPLAAYREVGREVLVRAESTARDRVAARADPLAEVRDRARAEGDVDERVSLEDPLSLRLCVAAADGDDDVGSRALQRARVAEVGGEPRVRLLADRAGVEDDHVGLVGSDRLAEPERLEHALDALRVVRVHLAAERRDVVPTHRDQG